MNVVGISDIGLLRKRNEDCFLIEESLGLFVVCDGMGGHRGGDVASKLAIKIIDEMTTTSFSADARTFLSESIQKANKSIWNKARENPELFEMGTTITAVMVQERQLTVANVGDSGLFLIRNNEIIKLTKDHTLAEQMYGDGLLKQEEIRFSSYNHILTRALGIDEELPIDFFQEELFPGDILLLCSDGLSDMLDKSEILSAILPFTDVEKTAQQLVLKALNKGGYDNITIILVEI